MRWILNRAGAGAVSAASACPCILVIAGLTAAGLGLSGHRALAADLQPGPADGSVVGEVGAAPLTGGAALSGGPTISAGTPLSGGVAPAAGLGVDPSPPTPLDLTGIHEVLRDPESAAAPGTARLPGAAAPAGSGGPSLDDLPPWVAPARSTPVGEDVRLVSPDDPTISGDLLQWFVAGAVLFIAAGALVLIYACGWAPDLGGLRRRT